MPIGHAQEEQDSKIQSSKFGTVNTYYCTIFNPVNDIKKLSPISLSLLLLQSQNWKFFSDFYKKIKDIGNVYLFFVSIDND